MHGPLATKLQLYYLLCLVHHAAHITSTKATKRDCDLQDLILAVPPFQAAHQGPSLAVADFQELRKFVDYFSVMTYDASHPGRPGPNAPWGWVKSNIEAVIPVANERCANVSIC